MKNGAGGLAARPRRGGSGVMILTALSRAYCLAMT